MLCKMDDDKESFGFLGEVACVIVCVDFDIWNVSRLSACCVASSTAWL